MDKKHTDSSTFVSFAEGLRVFNTKGIIGLRVNLTKKRARLLVSIIRDLEGRSVPEYNQNDYCAVLAWMADQVAKRWSQNDLCLPRKRAKKEVKK